MKKRKDITALVLALYQGKRFTIHDVAAKLKVARATARKWVLKMHADGLLHIMDCKRLSTIALKWTPVFVIGPGDDVAKPEPLDSRYARVRIYQGQPQYRTFAEQLHAFHQAKVQP